MSKKETVSKLNWKRTTNGRSMYARYNQQYIYHGETGYYCIVDVGNRYEANSLREAKQIINRLQFKDNQQILAREAIYLTPMS